MVVKFVCLDCDLEFEDSVVGVRNASEVTNDLFPACPDCDSEAEVIVDNTQLFDEEYEFEVDEDGLESEYDEDEGDFIIGEDD